MRGVVDDDGEAMSEDGGRGGRGGGQGGGVSEGQRCGRRGGGFVGVDMEFLCEAEAEVRGEGVEGPEGEGEGMVDVQALLLLFRGGVAG